MQVWQEPERGKLEIQATPAAKRCEVRHGSLCTTRRGNEEVHNCRLAISIQNIVSLTGCRLIHALNLHEDVAKVVWERFAVSLAKASTDCQEVTAKSSCTILIPSSSHTHFVSRSPSYFAQQFKAALRIPFQHPNTPVETVYNVPESRKAPIVSWSVNALDDIDVRRIADATVPESKNASWEQKGQMLGRGASLV